MLTMAPSMDGLQQCNLEKAPNGKSAPIKVKSSVPPNRISVFKWNGWGYTDSRFVIHPEKIKTAIFTGNRYPICETELPYVGEYIETVFGIPHTFKPDISPPEIPNDYKFQPSIMSEDYVIQFKELGVRVSLDGVDRMVRSHGQAMYEIVKVRNNKLARIADLVMWPAGHKDVVNIVNLANTLDVVVLPIGGGSSVSGASEYPADEKRPIIALDMCIMNSILWIDDSCLTARCEAGIFGQDLERELQNRGYTCGHEPDSLEFSTLGGWVATYASGMKKNTYGNIEDIVIDIQCVTPVGVVGEESQCGGPNLNRLIIGSEGSYGVVTEVTIKIRPVPKCVHYGSLVFPNMEAGVKCLREVARQRCQPSSIRLMDNGQYQMARSIRPAESYYGSVLDYLKCTYITKVKGFSLDEMCVATLLYEGEENEVNAQESKINKIATSFGAFAGGPGNGERGYRLTFVIAYIRDMALDSGVYGETVETSVPWHCAMEVLTEVKKVIAKGCANLGITYHSTTARVAQIYDAGCCLYFYFVINAQHMNNPMQCIQDLDAAAKDVIMALGGSISHHHGVGKQKKKWYRSAVSPLGENLFKATKISLDPNNIFATLNLVNDYIPQPCKL